MEHKLDIHNFDDEIGIDHITFFNRKNEDGDHSDSEVCLNRYAN